MTVAVGRDNDNTKLTRAVSTKLSIKYYNELQTITDRAYRNKGINKPTISEFLRFMINLPFLCHAISANDCLYTMIIL